LNKHICLNLRNDYLLNKNPYNRSKLRYKIFEAGNAFDENGILKERGAYITSPIQRDRWKVGEEKIAECPDYCCRETEYGFHVFITEAQARRAAVRWGREDHAVARVAVNGFYRSGTYGSDNSKAETWEKLKITKILTKKFQYLNKTK
jgi:hypothetical protein